MASLDYEDFEYVGVACKYCGEDFPIQLIMEHELLVHGDILYEQNQVTEQAEETAGGKQNSPVQKNDAKADLLSLDVESINLDSNLKEKRAFNQDTTEHKSEKPAARKPTIENHKKKSSTFYEDDIKAFSTQESETKLMEYGTKKEKDPETEHESYKIPDIPVLSNSDPKEDKLDTCDLSDDEASESLEQFWARAKVILNKRKMEIESNS